ncbi:hypothetical protein J6590_091637, partial [Homalodisca vitripennis]
MRFAVIVRLRNDVVLSTYHDKLFDFRLMRMNVSRQASPTSIPTYYSDESYVK